jgi:hypothetical protein
MTSHIEYFPVLQFFKTIYNIQNFFRALVNKPIHIRCSFDSVHIYNITCYLTWRKHNIISCQKRGGKTSEMHVPEGM